MLLRTPERKPRGSTSTFLICCSRVPSNDENKLSVRWSGPARIVDLKLPPVSVVEDLINGRRRKIHSARLKRYCDVSLTVNEELTNYLVCQFKHLYMVAGFKESRSSRNSFEVLTSWAGFPSEDTWQSLIHLTHLNQDVPDLLRKHMQSKNNDLIVKEALQSLSKFRR